MLLKNENDTLPLKKDLKTVAVIGPNADSLEVLLGNYNGIPSRWVTPLEGIRRKVSSRTRVLNALGTTLTVYAQNRKLLSKVGDHVYKGDPVAEVRRMKNEPGEQMVIMGSGTIVSQLMPAGLIDEYQFVVIPVVLGEGKTMFEGTRMLNLTLTKSRTFRNGKAFLVYEPKA